MASPRTFTPQEILDRATEYGIAVSLLEGDNLALDIPTTLGQGKKAKAVEVIKSHKPEIIAYLRAQEPAIPVVSTGDTTNHPPGVGVPGQYQASTSTPDLATLRLVTPYVPEPVQDQTDEKQGKARKSKDEFGSAEHLSSTVGSGTDEKLEKTRTFLTLTN